MWKYKPLLPARVCLALLLLARASAEEEADTIKPLDPDQARAELGFDTKETVNDAEAAQKVEQQ